MSICPKCGEDHDEARAFYDRLDAIHYPEEGLDIERVGQQLDEVAGMVVLSDPLPQVFYRDFITPSTAMLTDEELDMLVSSDMATECES